MPVPSCRVPSDNPGRTGVWEKMRSETQRSLHTDRGPGRADQASGDPRSEHILTSRIGLAVIEERLHLRSRRPVKQAAVFIQHRLDIGFLAAPPHPSGEVNLEVIEADVRIVMSPRKAQPNVFA